MMPRPVHPNTTTPNFGHQDTLPWYKNYMVVIFVIGLPLFVVVACLYLVYFSVQVKDSVVRDDWYMDGKTLYQDVSRDKLAYDLDLNAQLQLDYQPQEQTRDISANLTFYLNYPQSAIDANTLATGDAVSYPETLALSISHATEIKQDHDVILQHQSDNKYVGEVSLSDLPSKYYIQISNEGDLNWRLRQTAILPQTANHNSKEQTASNMVAQQAVVFSPLESFAK